MITNSKDKIGNEVMAHLKNKNADKITYQSGEVRTVNSIEVMSSVNEMVFDMRGTLTTMEETVQEVWQGNTFYEG